MTDTQKLWLMLAVLTAVLTVCLVGVGYLAWAVYG